jgi:hypothetical protein
MKWLWSIVFVAVAATTAAHAADMPNNKFLGTWCLSGVSDGDLYKRDHPNLHPGEPPCSHEQGALIEITRDGLHPRGEGIAPWQKAWW